MKLNQLEKKQKAIVKKINASPQLKHRLYSLGVIPGSNVEIINHSIGRKTIEIKVNNSLIALRDNEAKNIEVESNEL